MLKFHCYIVQFAYFGRKQAEKKSSVENEQKKGVFFCLDKDKNVKEREKWKKTMHCCCVCFNHFLFSFSLKMKNL